MRPLSRCPDEVVSITVPEAHERLVAAIRERTALGRRLSRGVHTSDHTFPAPFPAYLAAVRAARDAAVEYDEALTTAYVRELEAAGG